MFSYRPNLGSIHTPIRPRHADHVRPFNGQVKASQSVRQSINGDSVEASRARPLLISAQPLLEPHQSERARLISISWSCHAFTCFINLSHGYNRRVPPPLLYAKSVEQGIEEDGRANQSDRAGDGLENLPNPKYRGRTPGRWRYKRRHISWADKDTQQLRSPPTSRGYSTPTPMTTNHGTHRRLLHSSAALRQATRSPQTRA